MQKHKVERKWGGGGGGVDYRTGVGVVGSCALRRSTAEDRTSHFSMWNKRCDSHWYRIEIPISYYSTGLFT